ncbi:MAG: LuxR C-terminal-related transcriptional regulator [Labilithrix sp.]
MLAAAPDANRSAHRPDDTSSNRSSILRARPSWDAMLAAIHDLSRDEKEWARETLEAARDVFQRGASLAFYSLEKKPAGGKTTVVFDVVLEDRRTQLRGASAAPISVRAIDENHGVAISVRPTSQRVTVLTASFGRAIDLATHERNVLARIGFYLEAAQRRRLRPEVVLGRVSEEVPEGLWSALLAGERTLVAQAVEDGGIAYEILVNDEACAEARSLTAVEREVLSRAARGATGKEIAIDVGLSASAVSVALASAAAKIGATSTTELLRLGGLLEPIASDIVPSLTAAEQDVLELLRRGLRNDEIATLHGRAVRTVANQVAAILRKTGRPSRRALLVGAMRGRS